MTCQTCGRPAENGVATHWLGCAGAPRVIAVSAGEARDALSAALQILECEHDGCSEPKREGSGKGAKPKYCDDHSDPKNRK
jgi:hypothetical protein